jgi:glucose-1-phosphate thymidylyltransferase
MQASQFVQVIEERQGHYVAALEEIAYRQGWISRTELLQAGLKMGKNPYGDYLMNLAEREEPCLSTR